MKLSIALVALALALVPAFGAQPEWSQCGTYRRFLVERG